MTAGQFGTTAGFPARGQLTGVIASQRLRSLSECRATISRPRSSSSGSALITGRPPVSSHSRAKDLTNLRSNKCVCFHFDVVRDEANAVDGPAMKPPKERPNARCLARGSPH
jgi:hypothetical protein